MELQLVYFSILHLYTFSKDHDRPLHVKPSAPLLPHSHNT